MLIATIRLSFIFCYPFFFRLCSPFGSIFWRFQPRNCTRVFISISLIFQSVKTRKNFFTLHFVWILSWRNVNSEILSCFYGVKEASSEVGVVVEVEAKVWKSCMVLWIIQCITSSLSSQQKQVRFFLIISTFVFRWVTYERSLQKSIRIFEVSKFEMKTEQFWIAAG